MAEQYVVGVNRIFYKATSFGVGLLVTVKIYNRLLSVIAQFGCIESIEVTGLYYFDFDFGVGQYVMEFFENGIKKFTQVYNVLSKSSSWAPVFGSVGENVING